MNKEIIIPFEFLKVSDLGTELLNVKNLKKYINDVFDLKIDDTALLILNDELKDKLDKAFARTIANGRETILGQDI